jgi:hypothetical protein
MRNIASVLLKSAVSRVDDSGFEQMRQRRLLAASIRTRRIRGNQCVSVYLDHSNDFYVVDTESLNLSLDKGTLYELDRAQHRRLQPVQTSRLVLRQLPGASPSMRIASGS